MDINLAASSSNDYSISIRGSFTKVLTLLCSSRMNLSVYNRHLDCFGRASMTHLRCSNVIASFSSIRDSWADSMNSETLRG